MDVLSIELSSNIPQKINFYYLHTYLKNIVFIFRQEKCTTDRLKTAEGRQSLVLLVTDCSCALDGWVIGGWMVDWWPMRHRTNAFQDPINGPRAAALGFPLNTFSSSADEQKPPGLSAMFPNFSRNPQDNTK